LTVPKRHLPPDIILSIPRSSSHPIHGPGSIPVTVRPRGPTTIPDFRQCRLQVSVLLTEEGVSRSVTSLTRKTSPSGPSKSPQGHSISLSFTSPLPSNQPVPLAPSSEGHSSSRPAFHHRPSSKVAMLSRTATGGVFDALHNSNSQSTNDIQDDL